jgi:streptogramin lyase
MRARIERIGLMVLAALLTATSANAGPAGALAGSVHDEGGEPVHGALVTATHVALRKGTTVYTDAAGRFRLPALDEGTYDVRVRRAGFKDGLRSGVAVAGERANLALRVDAETDARELAWQLPASRWLPLLLAELPDDDTREEFTRQCTFCHQQGNWATRVPRSREDWEKILKLMARMGGVVSPELRTVLPDAFNAAYAEDNYLAAFASVAAPAGDPLSPLAGSSPAAAGARAPFAGAAPPATGARPARPASAPPTADTTPALVRASLGAPQSAGAAGAVITEWDVGHPASMQHDLVVHPDGAVYSVDTNHDRLYRLDPRTGERRWWQIPRGDSPLGGVFAATGALVAPNTDPHVAPHSLQVAPDGSIWITLCLGNKMARFDPPTEKWTIIDQEDGLYPHTLRFDASGRIWYTLAVSNHIGMIDPATDTRRTLRLPARTWRQAVGVRVIPMVLWAGKFLDLSEATNSSEGLDLPVPYGIDIAPDGGVWFSQLNVHRIGRVDPETWKIDLVDTPFAGPRRLRFDSKGNLWIPGFSAGLIARYTPATGEFRTWALPIEGVETPYALNVDRRTDTVWVCGTNSDTLMSFDPVTARFTVYPLPTRVTYTREIDFDDEGGVWTSNSNFPSWHIEGSGPKLIRITPGDPARSDADLVARATD